MKLFEITDEQARLNAMLEDNEGEITEELAEALAVNESNLNDKAANYRAAIMQYNSEIEAAKAEKKRLDMLIKNRDRAIGWMKTNLLVAMQTFNLNKLTIEGGVGGSLSLRKSEQVSIEDESMIGDEWKKVSYTIDKTAIKQAIKEGGIVTGATIVENTNLIIK